jgi:hypothetical protein
VKRLKGYNAFINEALFSGETWYRVYIGPYKNKNQAKSRARWLERKKVIASYRIQKIEEPSLRLQAVAVRSKIPPQEEMIVGVAVSEKATAALTETSSPEAAAQKTAPEIPAVSFDKPSVAETVQAKSVIDQGTTFVEKSESETKPEAAVFEPPTVPSPAQETVEKDMAKKAKDWSITVGYELWYIDMSQKYVNANFASNGFIHGPTIGFSKKNYGISFTYLATMGDNTINGTADESFNSGERYRRNEKLKREDYDVSLRYKLFDVNQLSISLLPGFKYTRLSDMFSTFTRASGQYTITGHLDIWGPTLGVEVIAPLGKLYHTPIFLSLGASGMYLRGTGKHPQFMPASGGQYGTTFEGADFSAYGWGGNVDAHLTWKISDGLQLQLGGRLQSAGLMDASPDGSTMRVSNGYYGGYTRLMYDW